MRDLVYCCGLEQNGKRYDLPAGTKAWKRLYFLDECVFCGSAVASLQECSLDGTLKILKRVSGKKAIELKNKLTKNVVKFNNPRQGSLENERTLFNDAGNILNFNGRKVTTNESFLKIK